VFGKHRGRRVRKWSPDVPTRGMRQSGRAEVKITRPCSILSAIGELRDRFRSPKDTPKRAMVRPRTTGFNPRHGKGSRGSET